MRHRILAALFLVPMMAAFAFADPVSLRAVRVARGPHLDGSLTDEAWTQAEPFSGFLMVFPKPGSQPTEKTEVRVVYDESNLYLGLHCFDSAPSAVCANSMAHDAEESFHDGGSEDIVRVLLDPFQDMRNAYVFFVNACGGRSEGLAFGEHYSLNWDGIWDAHSRLQPDGWSCEIRIPFKTISFKPGLAAWGLNIERYIPRKQETIRVSGTTQNSFFYNPREAASLQGIEGIRQGLGLTFRPYGTLTVHNNVEGSTFVDAELDGGFDIYKNFTPNLVGAFSYNTDFAETEVDERQINLTRFPLYFPEKRWFFLEGSDIFNFGTSSGGEMYGSSEGSFIPFFSRRIGLHQGQPVPIAFGAKVFGKVGNTNLAFLDVLTRDAAELAGTNFFAGRVTQNILAESKVGAILTTGSPSGERNTLAGLDFTLQTSRFRGDQNLLLIGWYIYNWNTVKQGHHQGYGFKLDYPNDLWDIAATYTYYGDALDPGIGFLPRGGVQAFSMGVHYMPRPEKGFIGRLARQMIYELRLNFYWDLAGHLETRSVSLAPLNLQTESGEHLEFSITSNLDVLPFDFEVSEGVVLPRGAYDFTNFEAWASTASHRPWALELGWNFGRFYSGHYNNVEAGLVLKFKGYVTLELGGELVRGDLPVGRFIENVYQVKADFFLSPDLGLMSYFQYDDVSDLLGASLRFRWQVSPGNEIYLVYNKNWERQWDPLSRFVPLEGKGVFKITLSVRP